MRDIRFRAWDKENHEMYKDKRVQRMTYYANPVVYDDGYIQLESVGQDAIGDSPIGERHIIMQFTGLKDKNGKEIYEGDILSNFSLSLEHFNFYEVIFDKNRASFRLQNKKENDFFDMTVAHRGEVIGNIYQDGKLEEINDNST